MRRIGFQLVCLAFSLGILFLLLGDAFTEAFAEEAAEAPAGSDVSRGEAGEVSERFLLWPLVSVEESPEWRQLAFRPFYVQREEKDGSATKVQFLWPLYLFRRDGEDVTIRIVPFFTYWRDVYPYLEQAEIDVQYMLFPIVFGGDSTREGAYFAVFPVGGRLKHFLGRDKITFILFPLYVSSSKGEMQRRSYLWPVFSSTSGGGYSGVRFWPLYGQLQKEGEYRREFILWPIYNHQEYDLDKEQPGERLLVLPLYAREDSARRHYRAYLWPFFSFEENLARNYVERATPWPFFIVANGDLYRRQYWPLYGHRKTDDVESSFLFWPFWHKRIQTDDDGSQKRERALMPIYSSKTQLSAEQKVVSYKSRIWPLWRFRRSEDGSTQLQSLALLWFDDEQGFERQYAPLWSLYERATTPEGITKTYAFWRLYRRVRTPAQLESQIPFLFKYANDAERDSASLKVLGGLVGSYREGNQRSLQMLYFIKVPR